MAGKEKEKTALLKMQAKFLRGRGKRMWFRGCFFFPMGQEEFQSSLSSSSLEAETPPLWCSSQSQMHTKSRMGPCYHWKKWTFWAVTRTSTYNQNKCRLWKTHFISINKCSFLTTVSYHLKLNIIQTIIPNNWCWDPSFPDILPSHSKNNVD